MNTILKQICIAALGISIVAQVACKRKVIYTSTYTSQSDSVIRVKADSIARAEGRDTTGNAAKEAAALEAKRSPDDAFVLDILRNYTQEIDIVRLGAENEGDRKMQATAKKILAEESKVFRALDGYIARKGLQLSADTLLDISYANTYDVHQWDSAWISIIEENHSKMIARCNAAKDLVADAEVQQMINNTIPVLNNQLATVGDLKTRVK